MSAMGFELEYGALDHEDLTEVKKKGVEAQKGAQPKPGWMVQSTGPADPLPAQQAAASGGH